jgi:hypothetical protein
MCIFINHYLKNFKINCFTVVLKKNIFLTKKLFLILFVELESKRSIKIKKIITKKVVINKNNETSINTIGIYE